jgi:hypothetical protein
LLQPELELWQDICNSKVNERTGGVQWTLVQMLFDVHAISRNAELAVGYIFFKLLDGALLAHRWMRKG